MKKILIYVVILVAIAVMGAGGMKVIKAKKAKEAQSEVPKTYGITVKIIQAKKTNTSLSLPYLAITKSNDDVKISSRVSARIKYIAKSGTEVNKGDKIVEIDDKDLKTQIDTLNLNISSLKSQLNSKSIALKNLLSTHERTQKLLDVNGASQEIFDREATQIEATKSGIDTLKFKVEELKSKKASIENMFSYTTIKSPVNGIVTRLANVGDVAMMGKAVISISSRSNSYLLVRLPSSIHAKSIVYDKKVYPISALNTTNNGLLEYLVNIDENLASNQTINVDVVIFSGNGYELPHDAILDRNGKNYVLAVDGGIADSDKATPKEVNILSNGEQGVIVDGLKENENIVVAKQDILLKLLSGVKIRAIK